MKRIFLLLLIGLAFSYGCNKDNLPQHTVRNYKLIPNYDFENWPPGGVLWYLPGWTIYNTYAVSTTEVAPDSLNAYHGHYAMQLLNTIGSANAITKFPITVHPLSLRAFVKCDLGPSDTVSIRIKLFFKGKETDSGTWFGAKSIDNYRQINIPISQHSAKVDTALIEITSGNHLWEFQPGMGSESWIDYLSFLLKQ